MSEHSGKVVWIFKLQLGCQPTDIVVNWGVERKKQSCTIKYMKGRDALSQSQVFSRAVVPQSLAMAWRERQRKSGWRSDQREDVCCESECLRSILRCGVGVYSDVRYLRERAVCQSRQQDKKCIRSYTLNSSFWLSLRWEDRFLKALNE